MNKNEFKFNVNERFEFAENFADLVILNIAKSLVLVGEGGLGKSYLVKNRLKENGKDPSDFKFIKGYCTPRGLYNLLYDNNGKVIIFDDCDSVLKDKTSENTLKSALDSYDERIISWAAKMPKGSEYPPEFEFTGRIIFISNLNKKKVPQPLITRSYVVDLSMTTDEKIIRIGSIYEEICKKTNIPLEKGRKAFNFLREYKHNVKDLSIRSFLDIVKLVDHSKNWERIAKYCISQ